MSGFECVQRSNSSPAHRYRYLELVVASVGSAILAGCVVENSSDPSALISPRTAEMRYDLLPRMSATLDYIQASSVDSQGLTSDVTVHYINGIAEGRGGTLYLLDASTKLLVRLSADGKALSILAGGYGDSAGQFVRPADIVMNATSDTLFVLDSHLGRVTVFDTAGSVLDVTQTLPSNAYSHAVHDSLYWVLPKIAARAEAASVFSRSGRELGTGFLVSGRERLFAMAYTGQLSSTWDGAILFGHPQPGTWSEIDSHGLEARKGLESMPDATVTLERVAPGLELVRSPGGTKAIGQIGEDRIAVLWATERLRGKYSPDEPADLEIAYYVDVFDRAGRYLGTTDPLRNVFLTAAEFAGHPARLHVAIRDPVELRTYSITESQLNASNIDRK